MYDRPIILAIFGIDGSGKTTQARALCENLGRLGYDSAYVWSRRRPYISSLPAKIIKKCVLKEPAKSEGKGYPLIKRKRTELFRNPFLRYLWINLSLAEYLFLIYGRILAPNRHKDILICDRYLYDAIIDFATNCSMTPEQGSQLLMGNLAKRFPKPMQTFFIDINAEVGAKRKNDGTSVAYLRDRIAMYSEMARITKAIWIDGTLPIERIKEIMRANVHQLLNRNDG